MLKSVELANFLSHANTKIDFERGVTVFVGPNGAGKSSVIDGITFALFGEHIRKSTKGLLRRGTNQAYAKVNFSIGNREFEAVRKIDAKGTISAQLYEKINNELVPIAAGERKQFGESMTKTIESLIGLDFEKLKVASIVQQGELQSIIEADPKKFKELVNAIIGIDKLDTAYEIMRKSIEAFRSNIKSRLGYDDTSVDALHSKIDLLRKEVSEAEPKHEKLNKEKVFMETEVSKIEKEIEIESPKEPKLREIETRKEELGKYLRNAIFSIKNEISEKERKIADCSSSLTVLSKKPQVESETMQLQHKMEQNLIESRRIMEKIANLRGKMEVAGKIRLTDGKCPVCDSKVDHLNPLFEEEHLKKELESMMKGLDALSREDATIQSKKSEFDKKLQQIEKAESTLLLHGIKNQAQLVTLGDEISKLRISITSIPNEINISSNLTQLAIDEYSTSVITSIVSLIEETKDFDMINFKKLKERLKEKQNQLNMINQEIGAITREISLKKEELEKIASIVIELKLVRQYVTNLEAIRTQIYNRDGVVATSLRSWALGMISQKASEYLTMFNVKIQRIFLEDKTRDISITCYSHNTILDLESLSGGEKVSVALALRLGMAHLMGSSNLNFIILDEPTTHLDQERRKSLVNVLSNAFESNLDSISQFIIITHDAEIFDNSNIDSIYDFRSSSEGTQVLPI